MFIPKDVTDLALTMLKCEPPAFPLISAQIKKKKVKVFTEFFLSTLKIMSINSAPINTV